MPKEQAKAKRIGEKEQRVLLTVTCSSPPLSPPERELVLP